MRVKVSDIGKKFLIKTRECDGMGWDCIDCFKNPWIKRTSGKVAAKA